MIHVAVIHNCKFLYFILQNKQPGAEEAFKILGHAFELIGESVSKLLKF